jgi:enoyl-CoA hydratase
MEDKSGTTLQFDRGIAILTIDRPQVRNAINLATMDELGDRLDAIEASDCHVLVLTGAGDSVFVSGGDLKELAAIRSFVDARAMAEKMRSVLDRLAALPIPVVGALNGDAYGGGAEVAVACDIRIAADHLKLAFNQTRLGIMPAWGGVERLADLVGTSRALYLMSTGEVITAAQALEWGLVERMAPRAEFEQLWKQIAESIAVVPRDALIGIKAVLRAHRPGAHPSLAAGATEAFAKAWIAEDHWRLADEMQARRRSDRNDR